MCPGFRAGRDRQTRYKSTIWRGHCGTKTGARIYNRWSEAICGGGSDDPLWGALGAFGMAASAIIGHRAGQRLGTGDAARSAGIRVFLFWLTVVGAAFLVPLAAGLWNVDVAREARAS